METALYQSAARRQLQACEAIALTSVKLGSRDCDHAGNGASDACYLKGRAGDAANVILSAVGYNLRLVLAWLRIILRVILLALLQTFTIRPALKPAS